MRNPTIFNIYFLNVLCVSWMQLQNLLFFLEPVTSLVPRRTTNCSHSRRAAPRLFLEDFLALVDQKPLVIDNNAISNKRNVLIRWITTLETQQILFFCDAMHLCTRRRCRNACVSRTLSKHKFLCQFGTNWGIYCFNRLQLPSTLMGHPPERWWIFPLKELEQIWSVKYWQNTP